MNGIICVNKPKDFTSFDVIAKMRGMMKIKRLGHAGTLDPMATGVLPIFVGYATRACDIMPDDTKEYIADFRFGMTTDTQDITGNVLSTQESNIKQHQLLEVLDEFKGEQDQVPPMYSAVRVNGQRLYDIARKGIEIERASRRINVLGLELLSFDEQQQTARIQVSCSKGTYIRTICHDIGQRLGVGATLTELCRTRAGAFLLEDCITLEQAQHLADTNSFRRVLLPIEKIFDGLPKINLNEIQSHKFMNGVRLDLNRVYYEDKDGFHAVFDHQGKFMGLGGLDREDMALRIEKMFSGKE
ncbi:MAG: tRNA pseudouridine 55 synthase [Oscillospiraceae bacterium]|nr:tRNA pseudouridine 55 synthase [Oscillospiraceae bacterium]